MGSSPLAQQEAVMMFDSYCKTVIKNCARRYWKREAKRSEHEYIVADDQLSIYPTDKDAFAEKYIITCGNVQAIFHCFALFTAVKQLKEKEKTVVVLKYAQSRCFACRKLYGGP
mgnify:CR=1 FL=1